MTSEGLGEMFEGDSADTCAGIFPLDSMGGRAEGLACADPGARTPIGASGNFLFPLNPCMCVYNLNIVIPLYPCMCVYNLEIVLLLYPCM